MVFSGRNIINLSTQHTTMAKRKESVLQTQRIPEYSLRKRSSKNGRRTSSVSSFRQGSVTIETALALPLFFIVSLMLLSMTDMMKTYMQTEEKIFEQTRQAAVYGSMGAGLTGIDGTDYVEFYKTYRVVPVLKGPGYQTFLVTNHCKAHIWNGYDNSSAFQSENTPTYVYVTESGSVYHRRRNCSHLNITIRSVSAQQVQHERSEDGSKYYPCTKCARGMSKNDFAKSTLYVASYGTRYHISLTCQELKRTVYTVPFSQVGGRPACSLCGGRVM